MSDYFKMLRESDREAALCMLEDLKDISRIYDKMIAANNEIIAANNEMIAAQKNI